MAYSCSDLAEDVLNACVEHGLIAGEDIAADDPQAQGELVLNALQQLAEQRDALKAALLEIAQSAEIEEPDIEDYDDTESACARGVEAGMYDQAKIARTVLDKFAIAWMPAKLEV